MLATLLLGAPAAVGQVSAGVSSPNVEHVRSILIPGGATSATIVGKRLYVAGWSTLSIFDISEPSDPVRLSEVSLGFQFPHEDVATNGKILLLAETSLLGRSPLDKFHIWDVRDPRHPREIAAPFSPNGDRSLSCIQNCSYAYGAAGTILDLADPANPQVAGDWGTGKPVGRGFDVTEVRSGMVLTSTRPMMLLDGREDVLQPRLVAVGEDTARTAHFTQWPRNGNDSFILSSVETFGKLRCESASPATRSGPLITWDAATVRSGTIRIVDEFRPGNGTVTDGSPILNKLACSSHVFDAHPDFHDGGLVALGHFDHGTRFVEVAPDGTMSEIGYFMPYSGQTLSARWATDHIVYAVDLERGIDVLRMR